MYHGFNLNDIMPSIAFFLGLGTIETWYKKEGDLIKRDEVICDIRTEVIGYCLP